MELGLFKKINKGNFTFRQIWDIYDSQFDAIRNVILSLGDKYTTESFTDTNRQLYILAHPYNNGQLFVYLNGVLQIKNKDYEEVDAYTVRLLKDINLTDETTFITVKTNILGNLTDELLHDCDMLNQNAKETLNLVNRAETRLSDLNLALDEKIKRYMEVNESAQTLAEIQEAKKSINEYKQNAQAVLDTFGNKINEVSKVLNDIDHIKDTVSTLASTTNNQIDTLRVNITTKSTDIDSALNALKAKVGLDTQSMVNSVLGTKVNDFKAQLDSKIADVNSQLAAKITEYNTKVQNLVDGHSQDSIQPKASGVNTQDANDKITFKKISTADGAPVNGFVIEYGTAPNKAQLLISSDDGHKLYLGGWKNNTREAFKELVTKEELTTMLAGATDPINTKTTQNASAIQALSTKTTADIAQAKSNVQNSVNSTISTLQATITQLSAKVTKLEQQVKLGDYSISVEE